jgi:hypothetical protein
MTCITVERRLSRAIYLAKRNGGKITRSPASHSWKGKRFIDDVGNSTIVAMVESGLARYTRWYEGKIPPGWAEVIPVEVTLTELAVSREGQV